MKLISLFFIILTVSLAPLYLEARIVILQSKQSDIDYELQWRQFISHYNKTYASDRLFGSKDEVSYRREIFFKRVGDIALHNAQANNTYIMGINRFSDQSNEELSQMFGSSTVDSDWYPPGPLINQFMINERPIPESVDWRDFPDRVGPVKDQLDCNSCWAFSTVGMLEGQMCIRGGHCNDDKLIQLSEQNLLDCSGATCEFGKSVNGALELVQSLGGLASSLDYPYTSVEGVCQTDLDGLIDIKISSIEKLPEEDELLLKRVVAFYGPVAVSIEVSLFEMINYENGVYAEEEQPDSRSRHAVVLVGYGCENDEFYWLIKNSWGADWGDEGYIKLSGKKPNDFGITEHAFIAGIEF